MSFHQSITFNGNTVITIRENPNPQGDSRLRGIHFENTPGFGEDGTLWVAGAEQMKRLIISLKCEAEEMTRLEKASDKTILG